ncbi:hypothetical protein N181_20280 [Sinorhizobium fredii USDA 205]|nr:hypothetical protein N181_20280 [Sinorhizobium fredii USDA 205]
MHTVKQHLTGHAIREGWVIVGARDQRSAAIPLVDDDHTSIEARQIDACREARRASTHNDAIIYEVVAHSPSHWSVFLSNNLL